MVIPVALVALVGLAIVVQNEATPSAIDRLLQSTTRDAVGHVVFTAAGDPTIDPADVDDIVLGYPQVYVIAARSRVTTDVLLSPRPQQFWPDAPVMTTATQAIAAERPKEVAVTTAEGPVRLMARPLATNAGGRPAAVVAVASGIDRGRAHARLVHWVWIICSAAGGVGALVGLWFARRSLRPLRMVFAQQDQLISAARHELGRPLSRLQATAESGLAGDRDPTDALGRVARLARDTGYVIEDLTTVAGLVAGTDPLHTEAIRLDEVVKDALSGRVDANPVETNLVPAKVDGHFGLLRRAVLNLIENATRHGRPDKGSPQVVVTVGPGCITVIDNGPGVEPRRLARLVAAANEGVFIEGLGLGLGWTMTSWIARLHGGTLVAENRDGGGLAVSVTVPTAESAALSAC